MRCCCCGRRHLGTYIYAHSVSIYSFVVVQYHNKTMYVRKAHDRYRYVTKFQSQNDCTAAHWLIHNIVITIIIHNNNNAPLDRTDWLSGRLAGCVTTVHFFVCFPFAFECFGFSVAGQRWCGDVIRWSVCCKSLVWFPSSSARSEEE